MASRPRSRCRTRRAGWSRVPTGGKTVTETAPGGITTTRSNYSSGRLKSVTGSGVVARYLDYDCVEDTGASSYFYQVTENLGTSGSDRETVTEYYWTNAVRRISTPNPAGGDDIVTEHHYNGATGRLERISSTAEDTADQIFALAATASVSDAAIMGNYTVTGWDNESNGLTFGGDDRVTETSVSYAYEGDYWWRKTSTKQYHTSGSSAYYETVEQVRVTPKAIDDGLEEVSKVSRPGGEIVTTTAETLFSTSGGGAVTVTVDSNATTETEDAVSITENGYLVSQAEFGAGNPATFEYDADGRLVKRTDARGGVNRWIYDDVGQLVRTVDHLGNANQHEYLAAGVKNAGRLYRTVNAEGEDIVYEYTDRGEVSKISGSGTYLREYGYSTYGELTSLKTFRDGQSPDTTTWTYDAATGLLQEKEDADENTISYTYLENGQVDVRTWARGTTTTYSYNIFGDLTGKTYNDNPGGTDPVVIDRDRLGRPIEIDDSGGTGATSLNYDTANGELAVVEYENGTHAFLGGITLGISYYDSQSQENDRRIGARKELIVTGTSTAHAILSGYDSVGRLKTVSDSTPTIGTVSHTYTYDAGTSLITQVASATTGNFAVEDRHVDLAGRLTGIVTSNGSASVRRRHGYLYDTAGRRTRGTREDGTYWNYGYNDRGEVTEGRKYTSGGSHLAGHQFKYEYDGIGNRKKAWSGGDDDGENLRLVTYTTDQLNQYDQIDHPGNFDVLGRAPSDWVVEVAYDPGTGTATSDPATDGARQGELFWLELDYDNDTAGAYKSVTVRADEDDPIPNPPDAETTVKQWIPKAETAPTYDDDGNLAQDDRWVYTWDAENRLIKMEVRKNGGQPIGGLPYRRLEFEYDWLDRRIAKRVYDTDTATATPVDDRRFLYDGWNLVAEFTEDSGLSLDRRYIWGTDLSGTAQGAGGVGGLLSAHDGSTVRRPAYDGNGNITGWLNASGALVGSREYDPFGNTILREGDLDIPFGFSTKYEDAKTELYYYGYRDYDPVTGRWPSRDPIGEQGGVNLYGFVGNDGVNRWDFLGFCGSGSLFAEWLLVPHPGGESRFLPWSCFDEHGHHRKALCGRWLTANWPTLEKKCTELNCDPQVGFATTKFDLVGRTEAQFFSHIGMISHYDGIAYGSFKHNPNVDLEKTCKGNDCKCTFYIELQVTAKDRVDFNPGGRFGPWGIFRDDWFRFIDRAAGPWAGHNFNIAAEIEHRQIVYQWDYVKRRGKMLHND